MMKKHLLEISSKIFIGDNGCAITLSIPNNLKRKFNFIPGQYINIFVTDDNGVELSRCYSIFSNTDCSISFFVKRIPNGIVSNLLCDNYQPNDWLETGEPTGDFTLKSGNAFKGKNILFIVGGSGITPVRALIDQLLEQKYGGNIYLIYGNVKKNDIIFYDYLNELECLNKLRLVHILEDGSDEKNCETGRLTVEMLDVLFKKYNIPFNDTIFYASGPPIVSSNAKEFLVNNGVSSNKIRSEKFFSQLSDSDLGDQSFTITIIKSGKYYSVPVKAGQTILEGALSSGITVDYSCRVGECKSCLARVENGSVKSIDSTWDKSRKVLMCQSYPQEENTTINFDKSILEQIFQNRNGMIIIGLVFALLILVCFTSSKNEKFLAKGDYNTGHTDLKCRDCHVNAQGTLRQQIQFNVRNIFENKSLDFNYKAVTNNQCLACHLRPNDRHPTHRFNEPKYSAAREKIHPEKCISCHDEHNNLRVTIPNTGFCENCHKESKINNDPLDKKHFELIKSNSWKTCLQCHDFHGNHKMQVAKFIKDTIPLTKIEGYFKGGNDPYSTSKMFKTIKQ